MRYIKRIFLIMMIILGIYYVISNNENNFSKESRYDQKESLLEKKQQIEFPKIKDVNIYLYDWIGESVDNLIDEFGDPDRKDLSPYGYESFIYAKQDGAYTVFGVDQDEIVTAFIISYDLQLGDISIGQSYEEIQEIFPFKEKLDFQKSTSTYTFSLSADDLSTHPLVKIDSHTFLQFYFDVINNELVAIRFIDGEYLLLQKAYEVTYRGSLPEHKELSRNKWNRIEEGQERQTFEITNIIRKMHGINRLSWEEEVSKVAFEHSRDMSKHDYFSHKNLSGEGLTERLAHHQINYEAAGENIAANYPDALATVIGWLNSDGHRDALLNDRFTHLGVGVFEMYYTQNFLSK